MTYRERFGTFERYQEAQAQQALEYHRGELDNWDERRSFYFTRCNMNWDEVEKKRTKHEKAAKMLGELLASEGRIKNPLYLYKWQCLADKECSLKEDSHA